MKKKPIKGNETLRLSFLSRKGKKALLFRYILSYLCVLVVPIIFFAFLVNLRFLKVLKEEISKDTMNALAKVMTVTDANLQQLEIMKQQILLDQQLHPFQLYGNIATSLDYVKRLRAYKSSNHFLYEMAVTYWEDDYIYTSQGSSTREIFYDAVIHYPHWNRKDFLTQLSSANQPFVRPAEDVLVSQDVHASIVTFVYPLAYSSYQPNATLLCLVHEQFFTDIMRNYFNTAQKWSVILDENNQVITSQGAIPHNLTSLDYASMLSLENRNTFSQTVCIQEEDYQLSALRSDTTDWTYLSFTPLSYMTAQTERLVREMFLYLAAILAIASVVIFFSIRRNYFPIRKLRAKAERIFGHHQEMDELETVENTMQYLEDRNSSLIRNTYAASREYLLRGLLQGKYSPKEFSEQAGDFGLAFPYPFYAVISIRLHIRFPSNDAYSATAASIRTLLESGNDEGYILENMSLRPFTLMLNVKEQERFPLQIESLHQRLVEHFGCPVTLGAGGLYRKLEDMPNSFMEASYADDYRFIRGKGYVIFASEVRSQQDKTDRYPYRELEKLKYLIRQGDVGQVNELLDSVLSYVKTNEVPMFVARRLCFDLVNIVTKSITDLENQGGKTFDIERLSEFETVDELTSAVSAICSDVCILMKEDQSREIKLIDRMKAYIWNHYTDCGFSLQTMADHFDMGTTNLSQYFKSKTGQTIIDYTTNMRMERAKEILHTQKYKLGEVAEMIGYINTSSFIRRFKQYAGVTPGQYARDNASSQESVTPEILK